MTTIASIDHPVHGEMLVFADYQGIFLTEQQTAKCLMAELQKTYAKISPEDIEEISKLNLLGTTPSMYSQCYSMPPTSISAEEFQEYFIDTFPSKNKRAKKTGYVYFLKYGEDTKIGRAINVKTRIKELTKSMPRRFTLIHTIKTNDYAQCEKNFHDKYKEKRGVGEWFSLSDQDLEDIKKTDKINFPKAERR